MSAQQNQRQTQIVLIPLGSLTADGEVPGCYLPRKSKVVSAHLLNNAAIAASDSDFVQVSLKNGSTVIAEMDSRAAHENGIADKVAKALNVVEADSEVAAGSSLKVDYQETGTVALTLALLQVEYYQIGKNS